MHIYRTKSIEEVIMTEETSYDFENVDKVCSSNNVFYW